MSNVDKSKYTSISKIINMLSDEMSDLSSMSHYELIVIRTQLRQLQDDIISEIQNNVEKNCWIIR